MKLRNKIDGTITEGDVWIKTKVHREPWQCKSLEELNEHWEDYTPAKPLIKDEKIRKAVRAWAEADGADEKIYLTIDENGSRFANKYAGYIEFGFQVDMDEGLFTIDELCGEEDKDEA